VRESYLVLKEQFQNWRIIYRMSRYDEKSTYQTHYLGLAWQVLNPIIQILTYYLVFGIGFHRQDVNGIPFINWMLFGMTVWFFVSASLLNGSKSVYSQVGLVSKMKFPVSILPTISMISQFSTFIPMIVVSVGWGLLIGITPTLYWLQSLYYFVCMIVFLIGMGVLNSTISMLVRDYHILFQSVLRLLFYLSGTIMNIEGNTVLPKLLVRFLTLNPLYYLTSGFRDSFLSERWFWERPEATLLFWFLTLGIFIVGSHIHLKFRAKFVDYV
jgi:teichoic acid transport system permease protein